MSGTDLQRQIGSARDRGLLVLRALAGAHGDMSTAEVARECFAGKVPSPIRSAYQTLRRLAAAGQAELSGSTPHRGALGGPVFTWRITDAGVRATGGAVTTVVNGTEDTGGQS